MCIRDSSISGNLILSNHKKIKYDIMGPFYYIPFMECSHFIVSMSNTVNGAVNINGIKHVFSDGLGYIEGDRGCSFPRRYFWTQCLFDNNSVMLSIADIPLFLSLIHI